MLDIAVLTMELLHHDHGSTKTLCCVVPFPFHNYKHTIFSFPCLCILCLPFSHFILFLGMINMWHMLFLSLIGSDVSHSCGFCAASSYESEVFVDPSKQQASTSSNPVVSNGHYQLPKEYDSSLPHIASNGHHQVPQEHNAGYSSKPSTNVNEQTADKHLQNQQLLSHEYQEAVAVSDETVGPVECQARPKYFPPYWPIDVVTEALEVHSNSIV